MIVLLHEQKAYVIHREGLPCAGDGLSLLGYEDQSYPIILVKVVVFCTAFLRKSTTNLGRFEKFRMQLGLNPWGHTKYRLKKNQSGQKPKIFRGTKNEELRSNRRPLVPTTNSNQVISTMHASNVFHHEAVPRNLSRQVISLLFHSRPLKHHQKIKAQ